MILLRDPPSPQTNPNKGQHGTDPWSHPVMSIYLYYSAMLADHGRHVFSCLLFVTMSNLRLGGAMTMARLATRALVEKNYYERKKKYYPLSFATL